jgi:hypothetical protein
MKEWFVRSVTLLQKLRVIFSFTAELRRLFGMRLLGGLDKKILIFSIEYQKI